MKIRSSAFALAAAALAAACSASPSDDAAATEGAINTAAGVCSTLDYGHAVAPKDFYRQFDSDAKAGEYLTKLLAQGRLTSISGENARFKEITHDERLVRLVDEVYRGFKKVFPKETEGMEIAPKVAILESGIVNAYAIGTDFAEDASAPTDKSPWIFVVHTALLERGNTDSELRGLFAHELGHLVLRTFLPEIRQRVRAIYLTQKSEDGLLGADQDDDPRISAHVEALLERQSRVGGLADLGLPVVDSLSTYAKVWPILIAQAAAGAPEPGQICKVAKSKMDELRTAQAAVLPNSGVGDLVARPVTAEEKANLERLSDEVASELRTCLAARPNPMTNLSLLELTAGLNKMESAVDPASPDHQKLLDLMLDAEKNADADVPNAPLVDRMLRAQAVIRSEFVTLRDDAAFPIDQIRVFDYEEDADDASVRILLSLGDDPSGVGKFLLSIAPPAAREACLANVAAGRPVSYGRFIDTHPSSCWRYYHATQFTKGLQACTTAPAAGGKTHNTSGRASVIDKAPSEMVERGYGRGLE